MPSLCLIANDSSYPQYPTISRALLLETPNTHPPYPTLVENEVEPPPPNQPTQEIHHHVQSAAVVDNPTNQKSQDNDNFNNHHHKDNHYDRVACDSYHMSLQLLLFLLLLLLLLLHCFVPTGKPTPSSHDKPHSPRLLNLRITPTEQTASTRVRY